LAKIAENKLTADRSTTELRWIFFFSRLRSVNFARAICDGKCFLFTKIAAGASGCHNRIVRQEKFFGCGGGI
jgi:hypothetical protein